MIAGASVSGTTTCASQILSYRVFIFVTMILKNIGLRSVGHTDVITDQLAHFLRRDDSLLYFLAPSPALQIRSSITTAQHFHTCTVNLDGFAGQLEGMVEHHCL